MLVRRGGRLLPLPINPYHKLKLLVAYFSISYPSFSFPSASVIFYSHFSFLFRSQLVDDILDYEAGEATLGKPGGADLRLGLATGPALYALEEHPEMGPLIERKFEKDGDVEMVRFLIALTTSPYNVCFS